MNLKRRDSTPLSNTRTSHLFGASLLRLFLFPVIYHRYPLGDS